MSAQQFQILNTGDPVDPRRRNRQWGEVGASFMLCGTLLIPLINIAGDIWFQMFTREGDEVGGLPIAPMSFEPESPYRVVPRALRIHPNGRPEAVLIETQYTGQFNTSTRPVWATSNNEDDDANDESKHIQPLSDAG